jgi:hypothetical protein
MIKLGSLSLMDGTPRIAVGFGDNVSIKVVQDAENLGLDIVEFRVDMYSSFEKTS